MGCGVMRFLIGFIASVVWLVTLLMLADSGIKVSIDTGILSTAIIIAGALAGCGGDE